MTAREARIVRVVPNGPILVEGPVCIELPDGAVVESDRFMVAICTCRRSKNYPLCDTSHRRRWTAYRCGDCGFWDRCVTGRRRCAVLSTRLGGGRA